MGVVAILVALVNFINGIFDLVNVSSVPFKSLGSWFVVLVLAIGIGLSVFTWQQASRKRRRIQAGAILIALLLTAIAWGGWALTQRLIPLSEFIVTVNSFSPRKTTLQLDIARDVVDTLRSELSDFDDIVRVENTDEVVEDEVQARRLGERHKSTMVIWGWYDDLRFRSFVELLKLPRLQQQGISVRLLAHSPISATENKAQAPAMADISHYSRIPATMSQIDFELNHASEQMAAVTAAILGIGLYSNEEYEQALALFDEALSVAEAGGGAQIDSILGFDTVYFHRAVVLMALGRMEQAMADLEQAININPDLFEAHHNLAIVYAQICDPGLRPGLAMAEAETAVRLRPEHASAWLLLGDLKHNVGQEVEAEAALKTAIENDPEDALAYQLLGDVYTAMGDPDSAGTAYEQALALLPASNQGSVPLDSTQRGDILLSAGRYQVLILRRSKGRFRISLVHTTGLAIAFPQSHVL
ncbi:MAG: tetratricopeptide repeat protein [Chloroflexi bacterium]|nr:tetratricopeptide repeat protein [Chloroflexota bacterium]